MKKLNFEHVVAILIGAFFGILIVTTFYGCSPLEQPMESGEVFDTVIFDTVDTNINNVQTQMITESKFDSLKK